MSWQPCRRRSGTVAREKEDGLCIADAGLCIADAQESSAMTRATRKRVEHSSECANRRSRKSVTETNLVKRSSGQAVHSHECSLEIGLVGGGVLTFARHGDSVNGGKRVGGDRRSQ